MCCFGFGCLLCPHNNCVKSLVSAHNFDTVRRVKTFKTTQLRKYGVQTWTWLCSLKKTLYILNKCLLCKWRKCIVLSSFKSTFVNYLNTMHFGHVHPALLLFPQFLPDLPPPLYTYCMSFCKILFIWTFSWTYLCVPYTCLVCTEIRKGHQVPWVCANRCLQDSTWVLGTKLCLPWEQKVPLTSEPSPQHHPCTPSLLK